MRILVILSSLLKALVILLLSCSYYAAPTHHLSIGVQGNTPTLIVTSSEIGITPQTMGLQMKSSKMDYFAKIANKDLNKNKFNKSHAFYDKKEKLPQIEKVSKPKPNKLNEKVGKTVKTLQYKNDQEPLKLKHEDFATTTTAAFNNKMTTLTEMPITKIKETSLKPLLTTATPLTISVENSKQNFTLFDKPQAVADTFTLPLNNKQKEDKIPLTSAPSTTLDSSNLRIKEFDDLTTIINYVETLNKALEPKDLKQMVIPANGNQPKVSNNNDDDNDDNAEIVIKQSKEKSLPAINVLKIFNENITDNDSTTQTPAVTTENENLLLTTLETKVDSTTTITTTTSTTSSTFIATANNEDSKASLINRNNAVAATTTPLEILSLSSLTATRTMTTTENIVDEKNQQTNMVNESEQSTTEIQAISRPTEEHTQEENALKVKPIVTSAQNRDTKESFETEISTLPSYEASSIQQVNTDENYFTSTISPLIQSSNEPFMKTENIFKITVTDANTPEDETSPISLTTEHSSELQVPTEKLLTLIDLQQTHAKTFKNLQPSSLPTTLETLNQYTHTITPLSNLELNATQASLATTEKVLKLIDLEQHVLKTIDDLKQPSLLISGQHDNGHDGLKNIKKKQLFDKHYVEALLHNKQDKHLKDDDDLNAKTTTTTAKPILMPMKHGYLGPILMEEKTFHVIHHPDKLQEHQKAHKTDIETQLRQRHFVELKVKADVAQAKETSTASNSLMATDNVTEKSSNKQHEIQSTTLPFLIKNPFIEQSLDDIHNRSSKGNKLHKLAATTTTTVRKEQYDLPNQTESTSLPTINKTSVLKITPQKPSTVLSTTVFQVMDAKATKMPMVQANTMFTSETKESNSLQIPANNKQTESKISDIQIEIYDSTIDSIIGSTNFKDSEKNPHDETSLGKTTKPPIASLQQERFTQYVIDRTETSTQEPINYSTIQVASGKPEPAAIEIHINVSESFGNDSEDLEFSYPQTEFNGNNENRVLADESYDDGKVSDSIKLKIPSNNNNNNNKDVRNDEILVVEIIDTDNITDNALQGKAKTKDELFITDVKDHYTTPPPPPPPPPYQSHFDRDSDTIFYISNTEVKVGESLPSDKTNNEERKLKLESQFFPANYMASTQTNINPPTEEMQSAPAPHHLYEEDIILSSSRNQQDSLKIYRNRNEPSPPLDVTYVGESIIEVEQSPDSTITTTYAPDHIQQKQQGPTPQADVIIQPAILPEISIGVPVIGELPPQIELKEIDFMPNEAQLHRSGMYDDNDNSNINSNDIDDANNNNQHDVDSNNNPHVDESSIQYGGDLIDESADGGFDGVEGSYPFGNPASKSYTSSYIAKLRKQQQQQQPNHVADYAHLYVNYGVHNMRKDELSADIKDSAEILSVGIGGGGGGGGSGNGGGSNEQNLTTFKDFLNKVSLSNSSSQAYINGNLTQSERMSNATAFSVMEDANDLEDKNTEDIINLISLAIGLFIVILPVVVTCSMFWALRYLYKKYHSNITDNGGYTDQTETKVPPNEDGMEKGEFVHETSSLPTPNDKDAIEKYPVTSNKPSTTNSTTDTTANSCVKFSTEKLCHLKTTSATTTTTTATMTNVTATTGNVSKTSASKRLSLNLNDPSSLCQCPKQTPPPPLPLTAVTVTEQIHTVHGVNDDNDVEMPGPNGSITKMTMENNLLIVETEQRNDISRVARETKMDYNKDGVFVVEVSRGIDSKAIPESPVTDGGEKMLSMFDTKQNNGGVACYKMANEKNGINNEKVQIHSPPPENTEEGPRSLHQIEEVDEPINSPHLNDSKDSKLNEAVKKSLAYKCNTGLSQSDLSSTSSSDSNKDYCYGNQALYVVEQNVYSTTSSTGNVVLKCDVKDIKDDDRNPGNDHYLKHSLDKKDEAKDNDNVVETTEKTQEGGSRSNSGESPAQKPSENVKEITEEEMEIKEEVQMEEVLNETLTKTQIPVQIEVHACADLIKDQEETKKVDNLEEAVNNEQPVKEVIEPLASAQATEVIQTSMATKDEQVNNDSSEESKAIECEVLPTEIPVNTSLPIDLKTHTNEECSVNKASEVTLVNVENISLQELDIPAVASVVEANISKELSIPFNTSTLSDHEKCEDQTYSQQVVEDISNGKLLTEMDVKDEVVKANECKVISNGFAISDVTALPVNGVLDRDQGENIETKTEDNLENKFDKHTLTNGFKETQNILNGVEDKEMNTTTLPEANEVSAKLESLQNGHNDSITDTENGFDSLMSLPAPPPTTDELQLNSDLSEQQMDSLPPPPPPEIFSLKDLPTPSLTNGCNADSPQSEESTSFYNTLPPPPPTTLEVSATASANTTTPTVNGKMHVSPLTPPASPPAHFNNNLHAGLCCSQPIAVDVNGS